MPRSYSSQTAYDEELAQRLAALLLAAWHVAPATPEDVADPRVDGEHITDQDEHTAGAAPCRTS